MIILVQNNLDVFFPLTSEKNSCTIFLFIYKSSQTTASFEEMSFVSLLTGLWIPLKIYKMKGHEVTLQDARFLFLFFNISTRAGNILEIFH